MPLHVLPGADIFYKLCGTGRQSLVFIHGGGCDHRDWHAQVEALRGEFAVLTLDLRGHGRSTGRLEDCTVEQWAADANALIDSLGIGPAILIGHSLGSRVAAEAAWQKPANTAALILLDGSRSVGGLAATEAPPATEPARPSDGSLGAIIEATIGPYADEATRRHVTQTMSAAPMDLLQQTVSAYTAWDSDRADIVFPALPASLPVLAIQSTYHDRFTARRSLSPGDTSPYLEFLRRALPQLQVTVLPHSGHFTMLEKSEEVTKFIREVAERAACRAAPSTENQ